MVPVDMTKISKRYVGLWVALDNNNRPVASGRTVEQVIKRSKKRGVSEPTITKIPSKNFSRILTEL